MPTTTLTYEFFTAQANPAAGVMSQIGSALRFNAQDTTNTDSLQYWTLFAAKPGTATFVKNDATHYVVTFASITLAPAGTSPAVLQFEGATFTGTLPANGSFVTVTIDAASPIAIAQPGFVELRATNSITSGTNTLTGDGSGNLAGNNFQWDAAGNFVLNGTLLFGSTNNTFAADGTCTFNGPSINGTDWQITPDGAASFAAGNVLIDNTGAVQIATHAQWGTASGHPSLLDDDGSILFTTYAVASLPAPLLGRVVFASDALNSGEAPGTGTGCLVYASSAGWLAGWNGLPPAV